jgi:hypothetical protein
VQTGQVNSVRAHLRTTDLPMVPNKHDVRHLIGDAAKSWIICGHLARGKARRFEAMSNRSRFGTRTISLIHGQWHTRPPSAKFDIGEDERKSLDPCPHHPSTESTRRTKQNDRELKKRKQKGKCRSQCRHARRWEWPRKRNGAGTREIL